MKKSPLPTKCSPSFLNGMAGIYTAPTPQTRKYPPSPEQNDLPVNFKIFSKKFNFHWFLAQTRKDLPLDLIISFRIFKDFQKSIKFALFLLKLALSSQNSLKIHENFQNFGVFP